MGRPATGGSLQLRLMDLRPARIYHGSFDGSRVAGVRWERFKMGATMRGGSGLKSRRGVMFWLDGGITSQYKKRYALIISQLQKMGTNRGTFFCKMGDLMMVLALKSM